MNQIDKIISVAERYVGIKESPANSNNVIFNTRYYGRAVSGSGFAWCCAFIWCLFQDIGAPELFYGGGKTASCTTLMDWAKSTGQFHTTGFRRGDIALFDFDGNKKNAEHVGIITEIGSSLNIVLTIEGNTASGEVMCRTRAYSTIIGVFRPAYTEDKNEMEDESMPRYNTLAEMPDWARPTVKKLIDMGAIRGSGKKGADGLPADLDLSLDMIRMLVFNDQAKLYV